MTSTRAILLVAAVSLPVVSLRADLYLVDLSGSSSVTGHMLRVSGIIDVDTATDDIAASTLAYYHKADVLVPLPTLPYISANGVDFVDVAGQLFIAPRLGLGDVEWDYTEGSKFARLTLYDWDEAPGDPSFSLLNGDASTFPTHLDSFDFLGNGSPLLIGTAVPEASALYLALVGSGVVGASRWRERRMQNSAVRS